MQVPWKGMGMRSVPDFLPHMIPVQTTPPGGTFGGAVRAGNGVSIRTEVITDSATRMELVVYHSPALIHGLLMVEVLSPFEKEVQRFFFGYRCMTCETVYLVPSQVHNEGELQHYMGHLCDPSELRRAVRNARNRGRSDGEIIMEGMGGKWWYETMPK